MTIEAELPDGTILEFPDGTDPSIVQAKVKETLGQGVPAPGSQPLSYGNMMKDSLTEIAGAVAQGGPMMAIGEAGRQGLANLGQIVERGGYQAGGMVTDALAPHVPPEVAGAAGYAANVGTQALPVVLGGGAGEKAAKYVDKASRRLMQSALKPSKRSLRTGDAQRGMQTMLDEGVNPTTGGYEKLRSAQEDLADAVRRGVADSPGRVTKDLPRQEIMRRALIENQQVTPSKDLRAVRRTWRDYDRSIPDEIPVQQAQQIKQGTYRALSGKYGELGSAETEAQKALARGLRRSIEEQVPGVKELNIKEGEILNAMSEIENRMIAGNRDIMGLAPIAANPKYAAMTLADRSTLIKSLLARFLYSGAKPALPAAGAAAGGAYSYSQEQ